MNRFFLPCILLGLIVFGTGTKTIHVSPDGNDSAAGTAKAPMKTPSAAIGKACAHASKGIRTKVILHGGEYRIEEPITVKNIKGNLTICAAKGEKPLLSGSILIKGWQKDSAEGIWKVQLLKRYSLDPGEPAGMANRFDLYCNGERQTLARWPDTGFALTGQALGPTRIFNKWTGYTGSEEGLISLGDGIPGSGADMSPSDRLRRWTEEPEIWMMGYWFWDWFESYHKVRITDAEKGVVELSTPHSAFGYRNGAKFYALNLLCELDSEKEFYLDRRDGTLYWYPPVGINPETADARVSAFNGDFMFNVVNCEGVTIEGLKMQGGRGGAVNINGGRGNTLKDCSIEMFGQDAVKIYGKDHLVEGCRLRELGCGGFVAEGGDRKTLEPSGIRITETFVEHFSLYKRTYAPAVLFKGVGLHLDHCLFAGSTSSALRYQANNILVEYNIFRDLVQESDDQGGLDTFYDLAVRGNVIRYNYWKDISGGSKSGAAAIRLDDMISGQTIYGNVLENCGALGFGGIQINGGMDNQVFGNVFFKCHYAVSCTPWDKKKWEEQLEGQKSIIESYDIFSDTYTSRYPEIGNIRDGIVNRNFIHDNLTVDVEEFGYRTDGNEMKNNVSVSSEDHDIRYFTSSKVLKQYGIEPIPFDRIGPGK